MTLTYSCNSLTDAVVLWEEGAIVADLTACEGSFDEKVRRARMMCAGAEMAEALQAAKHALTEFAIYVPYSSEAYELGGDVYSQIDDALTKARGEGQVKSRPEYSERAADHLNQLTECASCGVLHLEEELFDGEHLSGACEPCLEGER